MHLYCKHTDRNITQIDITSKRNVQGTDITRKRNVQGTDIISEKNVQGMDIIHKTSLLYRFSLNQFTVHVQGWNLINNK